MASEWPPAPPEGYQLDDSEYEQPWYVTLFLLGWLVGAYVGIPTLVIGVHGLDVVAGISREIIPQDGWEWMIYIGEVLTAIAIGTLPRMLSEIMYDIVIGSLLFKAEY